MFLAKLRLLNNLQGQVLSSIYVQLYTTYFALKANFEYALIFFCEIDQNQNRSIDQMACHKSGLIHSRSRLTSTQASWLLELTSPEHNQIVPKNETEMWSILLFDS